jgi:hypothetical protein
MGHSLAALADGRVVLFGGHGTGFKALDTAEIWSPDTETFTVLTMNHTHDDPAFAMLEDGRLLLAGGSADLGIPQFAAAELFDPATGVFAPVGDMIRFRSGAGAAAMKGGQVLIAGAWWTHNDAHTFGEVFNPSTGAFLATGALNTRRSHPVTLPTADGRAVVFGGSEVNGGPPVLSVELFDPASREFSVLQTELFPEDPGWSVRREPRPVTGQRLSDGRYLLLATRTREGNVRHLLFTFDPQTKTFAPFAVTPELPDGAQYSFWAPVVDNQRGRAHLLARATGSHPTDLCLFTVDLATGALTKSDSTGNLRPAYYLYGAGVTLLQDGRLFISGGSEDGSNFKPVQETLIVTPVTSTAAQPKLSITAEGENAVSLTWNPASGPVTVETSTDLVDWTVLSGADLSQGTIRVPLSTTGSCCYFRLRQTTP